MEFVRRELKEVLGEGNVLVNEPMSRHTTFCVGGPADLFLKPGEEELPWVMELLKRRQIPVTVIGKGSNLLVGDKGVRGAVIEVGGRMAKIRHIGGECITAQAGAPLARVAQEACKKGLSGLEFAAGIPGGIGGAIVMNAGAYGGEMKDIVTHVKVLDGDGNVRELSNRQMEFAYRNSCVPKNGYLVLEASFRLQSMDKAWEKADGWRFWPECCFWAGQVPAPGRWRSCGSSAWQSSPWNIRARAARSSGRKGILRES